MKKKKKMKMKNHVQCLQTKKTNPKFQKEN